MADEPTSAKLKTQDSPNDDLGADTAVAQATIVQGDGSIQIPDEVPGFTHLDLAETVVAVSALTIFCKAFLEALGKRAGDGLVDLVRTHVQRKGKPEEYHIGVDDGSAATIAITEDTPDEARLALLDLDVTADDLRGKVLRWDRSASAWLPADG
jgi:hypothetical protein